MGIHAERHCRATRQEIHSASRSRSSSVFRTFHPLPSFVARILPVAINFRKVGREMRR